MSVPDLADQAAGQPIEPKQLTAILRSRHRFRGAGESRWLELKSDLASQGHRSREDWVKLLRDIVSMTNSGGGYIVFGVGDDGELQGVDDRTIAMLDPARVRDQLSRYSPNARIATHRTVTSYYQKTYAALWVKPSDQVIVFDRPGDYTDRSGNQDQAFKDGVIYTRDSGGCRRATQVELTWLIQRFIETRVSDLVAKIERVAHVPLSAEILATDPQNPRQAYRLVAKGEGQPVRVMPEEDDSAVSLREVFRTDVPYEQAEDEVQAEVRLWKTHPDHRVPKQMCFVWYLNRNTIEWDVDSASFCLRSACSDWGYPMFWARWLWENQPARLRSIVREFVDQPDHPETQYAPYLSVGFFGEDSSDLLNDVRATKYKRAAAAADKLEGMLENRRSFLLRARSPGPRIRVADDDFDKEALLDDQEVAVNVLDRVVQRRLANARGDLPDDEVTGLGSVGHQLDLICYAPRSLG